MLDFNLYYAEKTAERRLEEIERTARSRQSLAEHTPAPVVPIASAEEPSRVPDGRGAGAVQGAGCCVPA